MNPTKLNSSNNSKWKSYYQSYIVTSIHADNYNWIVEELENLGNSNAKIALDLALDTSISLVEILMIVKDERELEDLQHQFSDEKYNVYLKQFNNAKNKLSKLAGYDVDVNPITKPIHSLYLLYTRNDLDIYQQDDLKRLFGKNLIKASKSVLTNRENEDEDYWQEIIKEYPHLANLPEK